MGQASHRGGQIRTVLKATAKPTWLFRALHAGSRILGHKLKQIDKEEETTKKPGFPLTEGHMDPRVLVLILSHVFMVVVNLTGKWR